MGTATARDPLAQLTTKLKAAVTKWDSLISRANTIHPHIFSMTYSWVTQAIERGLADTQHAAQARLGNTVRRSVKGVNHWYGCGALMHEFKIKPEACSGSAVRATYMYRASISKHELLRCIDACRDRENGYKIVRSIVGKSPRYMRMQAKRRVQRIQAQKDWNQKRMKMEAIAFATVMTHFYGEEVTVVVTGKTSHEKLLSVGNGG